MRKGILVVLLAVTALNLYLAFGVDKVQAQTCGVPGLPPCRPPGPRLTPTRTRTPTTPKSTPSPIPQTTPKPRPRMASVSIYSAPGALVTLNGKRFGQVASDGSLYISSLKPARYTVKISLNGYRAAIQTVTLKAGSGESLQMPLVAFPGILNITTNIQGATIEIEGVGTPYSNEVRSLSLDAGNYQITAWKTGYKSATQNEYIAPGQTKNIQIFLDQINIPKLLDEADQSYSSSNFQNAIALCNEVLAIEPTNARANLRIGLSLYALKEYDGSFEYLVYAISIGETLRLPFGRRRLKGPYGETLEFGDLELTQNTIAFYNKGERRVEDMSGTGQLDFKVPYSKITELKMENGYDGSWRLATKVLLPNKKGKKDKEDKNDFHFYNSSAVVLFSSSTSSIVRHSKIMCKACQPEIQFIYKLITNFRGSSRTGNANL